MLESDISVLDETSATSTTEVYFSVSESTPGGSCCGPECFPSYAMGEDVSNRDQLVSALQEAMEESLNEPGTPGTLT